ncbi:MAG: hypothetical protein R2809_04300, partial [Flavobacteriales bacterium]
MKVILSLIVILFSLSLQAQTVNQFPIGMFGSDCAKFEHQVNQCITPYTSPMSNGENTSLLNVLKEDGFNIAGTYLPNEWTSMYYMKNWIELVGA